MSAGRLGERERERKQRRTECCAAPAEWPRPLNPLIHQLSACSLEAGCTLPGEKNKKKTKTEQKTNIGVSVMATQENRWRDPAEATGEEELSAVCDVLQDMMNFSAT